MMSDNEDNWWLKDEAGETESNAVDPCIKYINCGVSRNEGRYPEWGMGGERDGWQVGKIKEEEADRKEKD